MEITLTDVMKTVQQICDKAPHKQQATSAFDDVYITKVIYQNPATVVFWSDGTKTVAKNYEVFYPFDEEKGLLVCIFKKLFPRKRFDTLMNMWSPDKEENYGNRTITLKEARKREKTNG